MCSTRVGGHCLPPRPDPLLLANGRGFGGIVHLGETGYGDELIDTRGGRQPRKSQVVAREFEPSVLKTAGLGGSLEDGPFDPL